MLMLKVWKKSKIKEKMTCIWFNTTFSLSCFIHDVSISVEFAPVLKIPRKRLGQALQFDMDLECHIEAYPPPAIRWYDGEGRLIRNNQHFRISHFTFDDEYVNTMLR